MKYYTLSAVVNGSVPNLKRRIFSTRDEAINYMFEYFDKNYLFGKEVTDEYYVDGDKHSIEYVCDYYNRFRITRTVRSF